MKPREEILNWILHDRDFDTGVALYRKHGNNLGIKHRLNVQGKTNSTIELLHYNLAKTANIPENELRSLLRKPVVKLAPSDPPEPPAPELDYTDAEVRAKVLLEMPEEARKGWKLREEFPFLNSADCPNEYKILVADLITSHNTFTESHQKLFETISPEETAMLSESVVENYINNRQIWDELVFYRDNGKPLGEHAIWKRSARLAELQAMPQPELIKLSKNIPTNITRIRKKLEEDPENKETANRQLSLEQYEWEFEQVKAILGI